MCYARDYASLKRIKVRGKQFIETAQNRYIKITAIFYFTFPDAKGGRVGKEREPTDKKPSTDYKTVTNTEKKFMRDIHGDIEVLTPPIRVAAFKTWVHMRARIPSKMTRQSFEKEQHLLLYCALSYSV